MAITRPNLEIIFKQIANNAVTRSNRGTAILIVKDDTASNKITAEYKNKLDVQESEYTEENYKAIMGALEYGQCRLLVARIAAERTLETVLNMVTKVCSNGWIGIANAETADMEKLASWVKVKRDEGYGYKAVVTGVKSTDNMGIIDVAEQDITIGGESASAVNIIPQIISAGAYCNINRSLTSFILSGIDDVVLLTDEDAEIGKGKLVLSKDGDNVICLAGINSLITYNGNTSTEDMSFIEVVEVMDMEREDISTTFKKYYRGKYKNTYSNQLLFISAVQAYFKELEGLNVLNRDYENKVSIDVDTQRNAWIGSGKIEAEDWDDNKVKQTPFKRFLFLSGDQHIMQCMSDLKFTIQLV